jgi:hypothetical protein
MSFYGGSQDKKAAPAVGKPIAGAAEVDNTQTQLWYDATLIQTIANHATHQAA